MTHKPKDTTCHGCGQEIEVAGYDVVRYRLEYGDSKGSVKGGSHQFCDEMCLGHWLDRKLRRGQLLRDYFNKHNVSLEDAIRLDQSEIDRQAFAEFPMGADWWKASERVRNYHGRPVDIPKDQPPAA